MDSHPSVTDQQPDRPLRPLYGIPEPESRGHMGLVLSGLLHALIILALLLPPLVARQLSEPEFRGAGGAGPAGGGGGGSRGTGGKINPESVRFLQVTPVAPASAPTPQLRQEETPAPVPRPPPEPEVAPVSPAAEEAQVPPSAGSTIPTPGTGGGSGTDGSGGTGPGSGGGVGSGVGTGRGSSTGPGTGGGGDEIFPPTVTNLALLPLPVPNRVRPYRLVAQFEVDERGNAKLISFNPSRDASYNRRIREMLAEVRFRPAVLADGTPVKDTAFITAEAP